jgi:hypothetical protein
MFSSMTGVARCQAMTRMRSAVVEVVDGSTCTFISILMNPFGCVTVATNLCIKS